MIEEAVELLADGIVQPLERAGNLPLAARFPVPPFRFPLHAWPITQVNQRQINFGRRTDPRCRMTLLVGKCRAEDFVPARNFGETFLQRHPIEVALNPNRRRDVVKRLAWL